MCNEADEVSDSQKEKRRNAGPGKSNEINEKVLTDTDLPQGLPKQGERPRMPQERIDLPEHKAGDNGNPSLIKDGEDFVDQELSEMSGKNETAPAMPPPNAY